MALCSDLAALADNRFDHCALLRCGVIFDAINAPTLTQRRTIGVPASLDSPWHILNLRVTRLDLNGRESGKTPIPHPLLIEPNGRRLRYRIQMQGDFQIAPMLAQKVFGQPQCLILG